MLSNFFNRSKTASKQPEPIAEWIELQEILPYVTVTVTFWEDEQGEDIALLIEDTHDFLFLRAKLKHWCVDQKSTNLVFDYVINSDNPSRVGIGSTSYYRSNDGLPYFHIAREERRVMIQAKDSNAKKVLLGFKSKYDLSSTTETLLTVGKEEPFLIALPESSTQRPGPR